jgi:hypothetical protein
MKIAAIKDVIRKDVPIYYRRLYTGVAVLEFRANSGEYRIDFAIEQKPTGHKVVSVTFLDTVDYPLIPIIRELKTYIANLDSNGELPD